MSAYYTILGRHTDSEYLVLVEDRALRLFPPGSFTLPWVGVSGHRYGISYYPKSSIDFRGPLWWAELRVRRYVAGVERQHRNTRRAAARAAAFAASRQKEGQ